MAPLVYRPRPKLHSWTLPEPPKPKRSRHYLWAIAAWLAATAVGYRWLTTDAAPSEPGVGEFDSSAPAMGATDGLESLAPRATATTEVATTSLGNASDGVRESARLKESTESGGNGGSAILPCEEFLKQATDPVDNRLPTYIGRSAIDAFIGENTWAKPCRSKHRRRADLCVAIRDGFVRGLSVHTVPPNLTLETCLREQASKLVLPPENNVRVVRTTLYL